MPLLDIDPPTDVDTLLADWTRELGAWADPAMTIENVARSCAETHPQLDREAARQELLDRLRIEMINAVVDVDMLAAALPMEWSPVELRRRIEGRESMTLAEYAHIRITIAGLEE